MKIAPRYEGTPIVRLDGDPVAAGVVLTRQRRRLAKTLTVFTPEQWGAPSRCDGWRVQDVVAHLTSTDQFWNASIRAGLAGTPTRFLAAFDPKATPAQLVDAVRDATPEGALAAFTEATEALCTTVESLDGEGWRSIAESPVGHVTIDAITHHALWDAWVHERDVLLPVGIAQELEDDEVLASLRYVAALAPVFALQSDPSRTGALALHASNPHARIAVVVADGCAHVTDDPDTPDGSVVLQGDAIDLLEALSVRAPLRQPVPPGAEWLVTCLAEVFESPR